MHHPSSILKILASRRSSYDSPHFIMADPTSASRTLSTSNLIAQPALEPPPPSNAPPSPPPDAVAALCELSTLVIIYPGRWPDAHQFLPSPDSPHEVEWFEGTGTVIGVKRRRVFILSSIHIQDATKHSFWVKGQATGHRQERATLVDNCFVENGIDVAVFSCDVGAFDAALLARCLPALRWRYTDTFVRGAAVWLVHYPTVSDNRHGRSATTRLEGPVAPAVAVGEVLSFDAAAFLFDSTIAATGGSSGGVVVDADGRMLGVHDSQHDDNPLAPGQPVSSHRAADELRAVFGRNRQVQHIFDEAAVA